MATVEAERDVSRNLAKLEVLKPRLNKRYERYVKLMRDREARTASRTNSQQSTRHDETDFQNQQLSDPALDGNRTQLAAGEHGDLAVRLAHQEIQRRARARSSSDHAGVTDHDISGTAGEERFRERDGNFVGGDEDKQDDELTCRMQMIRHRVEGGQMIPVRASQRATMNDALRYPAVPDKSIYHTWDEDKQMTASSIFENLRTPELPRKEPLLRDQHLPPKYQEPPSLPPKTLVAAMTPQDADQILSRRRLTEPTLQPSQYTFKPSAYLENGQPLRTIFLPSDLRSKFLAIAAPNTRLNLETCGILCGTLISNALFISKLVIPDQESTSDTCDTVNESELFDYCDAEDLMVLGWIHTHPTQTCFMSSRDLHTHSGYQVMMPESIAIVCAPSRGELVRSFTGFECNTR